MSNDVRSVELGRSTMTVLAGPDEAGGRYSLYRFDLRPESGGPAPHVHQGFAEAFVVLDGLVELYDGHRWRPGRPGDHLYVPEGDVHAFRHTDAAPVALLMLSAPAAPRELYFLELADLLASGSALADDFVELWARHDTTPA